MFDKLCDNLNLLMSEVHISADELARRTGIPASTIKKIRNRYNPNPTLSTLLPLAQYFSISLGQLVGDEPFPKTRIKGEYQINKEMIRSLPIITWVEIITWPATIKNHHKTISTEHHYSDIAYGLLIEEDDWENLVKGMVILVEPNITPGHRDFVIIHKPGQKTPSLKQIIFDEEQCYLKPITKGYDILPLTQKHKIFGVVIEYKKHFKREIC